MTETELLLSFLTKVYNKTEDEIRPLIFDAENKVLDNAFDSLTTLDAAKVKRFKDNEKTRFDNGYSKGKEETLRDSENLMKETFGITEDLTFPELLVKAKEASASKSKLTVDDVKKHPEYIALESKMVSKEKYESVVNEFETHKKNVDRQMKMSKVIDLGLANLEKFNPDYTPYSDAPAIKQNLINTYKKSFEDFEDFEITDNTIVAIKGGKRVEDEHGNPVTFEAICKQNASGLFKFLKQNPKGNANNNNDNNNQPSGDFTFTSKDEMTKAYGNITDPEKQKEFIQKAKIVTV